MSRVNRSDVFLLRSITFLFVFASLATNSFSQVYEASIGVNPSEFTRPRGMSYANGKVYITDATTHMISVFTIEGKYLLQFGGRGSGDGNFINPWSAAADADGNIYVADYGNHRIQKFTSQGVFLTKWGTQGPGTNQFRFPSSIAIDKNGFLFITDKINNRVLKFSNTGDFKKTWGAPGTSSIKFDNPRSVATDLAGNVYITDTTANIYKFDNEGIHLQTITVDSPVQGLTAVAVDASNNIFAIARRSNNGSDAVETVKKYNSSANLVASMEGLQLDHAHSLCVDGTGNLYVMDTYKQAIKFVPAGGTTVTQQWISPKIGPSNLQGRFNHPWGITFDNSGNIYVADQYNSRVQKFSPSGQFMQNIQNYAGEPSAVLVAANGTIYVLYQNTTTVGSIVSVFDGNGAFIKKWEGTSLNSPTGMAFDLSGNILIADTGNNQVKKFNQDGVLLSSFPAGLQPAGVTVDKDGYIYVAPLATHSILKYDPNGVYVGSIGSAGLNPGLLNTPSGVAIGPNGNLYVADKGNQRIQEFTIDGVFIRTFGSLGVEDRQFSSPRAISFSADGHLFVADQLNHRVQKYALMSYTSMTPGSGEAGTEVTINGSGFGLLQDQNEVRFSGQFATYTAVSATSLKVHIPVNATTGQLTVTRNGYSITSTSEFVTKPFGITSFTPPAANPGQTITIVGTGFSSVLVNNKITIAGATAEVLTASPTQITAIIPDGFVRGKVVVKIENEEATSADDFVLSQIAVNIATKPQYYVVGSAGAALSFIVSRPEIEEHRFESQRDFFCRSGI